MVLGQLNLRLDGPTNELWSLTSLPQSDGKVLGSVGLQQRNFGWGFLGNFLPGQGQVHCRTLSLCLKQLLKLLHIQVLRNREETDKSERQTGREVLRVKIRNCHTVTVSPCFLHHHNVFKNKTSADFQFYYKDFTKIRNLPFKNYSYFR